MSNRVLCIDGNSESLELLEFALAQRGVRSEVCLDAVSGLDRMRSGVYQAIILGYYVPGRTGPDLCRDLRSFDRRTPVLFYTAAASAKERRDGIEAGAQFYFTKPNDLDRLCATVTGLVATPKNRPN